MSPISRFCLAAAIAVGLASCSAGAGEANQGETNVAADPHQWLEDVTGEDALAWVREQNAAAEAELADTDAFRALEAELLAIYDSDDRIPGVSKMGEYYYNFWRDRNNERGIWRRTTLEEYRKDQPQWEVLLDLDALNAAEGENWVWHGANCLRPEYDRCLIALSRGGADADVTREFDLANKQWVEDGFFRPEAKGGLTWIDRDTVFVYTDFGDGTMTDSGYPRIVKEWKRGTPMDSAEVVYEGQADDMYISARRDLTPGYERQFVSRTIAFYNDELYLRGDDGSLTKIDAPNSANKFAVRDWIGFELREPWEVGGKTYAAGSLLVSDFDGYMAGGREFEVLFEPSETTSLAGLTITQNHVVINVLDDVKNRLTVLTPGEDGWSRAPFQGAPELGTVAVSAVDSNESDAVWMTVTDYLTPSTLMLADLATGGAPEVLKSMPEFFDASTHVAEQHFATSKDSTRVPYFLVRPKDMANDGSNPTLLYGYGGFEISLTPGYAAGVGKAWLEKGGVYAVANIRGGGEYGPRWHQAALKEHRHRAYEDFAAVAQDMIDRGITSPEHLGVRGGSNGGLLTGNMLTQYPELFGAVVIQVPLLDMQRYHKLLAGASWMAEYGNPDVAEEWEYIQTFSPYHLFDPAKKDYPPTILLTSTRDDRVHPGHARKMHALMSEAGADVRYYENIEGGHGGAANNRQAAHMDALFYTFLWQQLGND